MSFFSQSERLGETEAKPEEDDAVSSRTDFGGKISIWVGLFNEFSEILDLMDDFGSYALGFVSLFGMDGIGKTADGIKFFKVQLELY
ncbi:hypothetical protein CDL12_19432 [Handroanthus impetiginosus]|uniref:Uncharacterized protein n=1 Tax=Handroanthus impetiginosus TaxID=429701 RepID=A0A2G9GRU4_9LAMI|nr:hypothetical protein CDL12_19432 [Handroanthus impetiginosus]